MNSSAESILQDLMKISRQKVLQEFASDLIKVLSANNFHFSEFLNAMADCAERETPKREEITQTWSQVAIRLREAAKEAETLGRELP